MDRKSNVAPLLETSLKPISNRAPSHSWTATVLTTDEEEQSVNWDEHEVWKWCLSRVAAMGKLAAGHARLLSLLSWTPEQISQARDMAWDCLHQMHCSREEKQATWEYLSGDCLACLALDRPWEHPAAVREPVKLQVV
jgi:hypothetical protein